MVQVVPCLRGARLAYVAAIDANFRRMLASSSRMPWLGRVDAARNDAMYRLSIAVAAPYVLIVALAIILVKAVVPQLLPGRTGGYLFVALFVLVGLVTLHWLSRRLDSCAAASVDDDEPRTSAEWAFLLISVLCIPGYAFAAIFVF